MKYQMHFLFVGSLLFAGSNLFANEAMGGKGQMKETMQSCMTSGKSKSECRQEMRKNHQGHMGSDSCPMKGQMKGQHHNKDS